MAPRPVHHPMNDRTRHRDDARRRAIAMHPAGRARPAGPSERRRRRVVPIRPRPAEDGSMTTEYGLLVVVGATLASLVVRWASGGAVFELLDRVIDSAGSLLGL